MAFAGPQRNTALAFAVFAVALLLPCSVCPQAPSSPRSAAEVDPANLPAHDAHQGLLVAVRADTTAASSKAQFGKTASDKNPYTAGVLGLDVYFRNDTDQPIRVTLDTVQLVIGAPGENPQRLDQLSHQDVTDLILSKPKDHTITHRSPIPIPPHVVPAHDKNWVRLDDLLRNAAMPTATIQPHSTTHGYFYFDVAHKFESLSSARLEIPDLVFPATNQGLLFFEIDLAPAVTP